MKRTSHLSLSVSAVFYAFLVVMAAPVPAEETPQKRNGLPLVFEEDFESGAARWRMTDAKPWVTNPDNRKP